MNRGVLDSLVSLSLVLSLAACGSPGSSDGDEASDDMDDGSGDSDGGTGDSDDGTDDGGTGGEAAVESAFPAGLAVASPTESGPQGRAARALPDPDDLGGTSPTSKATIEPGKTYEEKQAELEAMIHGETEEDCRLVLPPGFGMPFNPMCYGPSLEYRNHPDAPDGATTDGMLPGGDLGLWSDTEASGEACSAAKLNGLVGDVGLKVDYGLYLAANMLCLMNVDGTELPAVGESVDMTAAVGTSLATDNPGLTVHEAALERLDDDGDGRPMYAYAIDIERTEGTDTLRIDTNVVHASDPDDSSLYAGKVWSRLDGVPPEGRTYGFSLRYERDEAAVRYQVVGANYPSDPTLVFDEDGDFALDGDYDGNITQGVFEIDPASGSTNATFAWQAGTGDSHTRVFNVYVDVDPTDKTAAGCGFFGYGPRFSPEGLPDNSISTFICNWAGPGNSHDGLVAHAQKQCMERDEAGQFSVVSSDISYAPVNDCDTTDDPGFEYRAMGETDWHTDPLPNALVDLTSDAEYGAWTPPSPPTE